MLFKTFGLVFFLVSKFIFVFEIEIGKKPQIDRRIKNNKKKSAEVLIILWLLLSCQIYQEQFL